MSASVASTCVLCGEPILSQSVDGEPILAQRVGYQIVGFEYPRKQGGTNMVRLRQRTGNVAHRACIENASRGGQGQTALFGGMSSDG